MTCKDCAHYDLCKYNTYQTAHYFGKDEEIYIKIDNHIACKFFKSNANNAELPCKIGDDVYCIRTYNGQKSHPQKGKVAEMYFTDDMRLIIVVKHIGRGFWNDRIFATEEEALENIAKGRANNA
jgi:hypothetical protein